MWVVAAILHWLWDHRVALIGTLLPASALASVGVYYRQKLSYVVEGILFALNRPIAHALAASLSLKRYCSLLLTDDVLLLRVASTSDVTLNIDQIYVTLGLEGAGGEHLYTHETLLETETLNTQGRRIRIVGDPGAGKTTLSKRLLVDACRTALKDPRHARFPIRVELRTLEPPKDPGNDWLFQVLRDRATDNNAYRMADCFDSYASKSGLLVILDGLDEVASNNYPRVRDALIVLKSHLDRIGNQNVAILTMRTQFHQQVRADFQDAFPRTLTARPFTNSDIYDFLSR
ncbi:MAG: NACHT domain-containing protein, partial [Chloroflexia bacterium]